MITALELADCTASEASHFLKNRDLLTHREVHLLLINALDRIRTLENRMCALSPQSALTKEVLADKPAQALPTKLGFYWWKETPDHDWSIVEVQGKKSDLYVSAVKGGLYGRTISKWEGRYPIGEWVAILPPDQS
jgi:hypothetical protein